MGRIVENGTHHVRVSTLIMVSVFTLAYELEC